MFATSNSKEDSEFWIAYKWWPMNICPFILAWSIGPFKPLVHRLFALRLVATLTPFMKRKVACGRFCQFRWLHSAQVQIWQVYSRCCFCLAFVLPARNRSATLSDLASGKESSSRGTTNPVAVRVQHRQSHQSQTTGVFWTCAIVAFICSRLLSESSSALGRGASLDASLFRRLGRFIVTLRFLVIACE